MQLELTFLYLFVGGIICVLGIFITLMSVNESDKWFERGSTLVVSGMLFAAPVITPIFAELVGGDINDAPLFMDAFLKIGAPIISVILIVHSWWNSREIKEKRITIGKTKNNISNSK